MNTIQNRTSEMFALIELWEQSGLSGKSFCKEQNISCHTFYYWLNKFKQKDKDFQSPGFVPINVSKPASALSSCEIVFPDGKRLIFHEKIEATFLRTLLF
jgi:hypothetical protein